MIISASRRTDIPAFYAEWFVNRLRAGECVVPNPFNPQQVAHISLKPEDVDVIVFWTRNPRPLFPYLDEIDSRGYRYYFQYTLMANPRQLDPSSPALEVAVPTFRELAERVGSERVIWRYDPLVFTQVTPANFHLRTYDHLSQALHGFTRRSVISLLDVYPKIRKRLSAMAQEGAGLLPFEGGEAWFSELMLNFVAMAEACDMEIVSCAEELDLRPYGIRPGKCVDDEHILRVFGLDVVHTKDPGQRKSCGCVVSKDIGMYDTCLFGCRYCYATSSFDRARKNYQRHKPGSQSLIDEPL